MRLADRAAAAAWWEPVPRSANDSRIERSAAFPPALARHEAVDLRLARNDGPQAEHQSRAARSAEPTGALTCWITSASMVRRSSYGLTGVVRTRGRLLTSSRTTGLTMGECEACDGPLQVVEPRGIDQVRRIRIGVEQPGDTLKQLVQPPARCPRASGRPALLSSRKKGPRGRPGASFTLSRRAALAALARRRSVGSARPLPHQPGAALEGLPCDPGAITVGSRAPACTRRKPARR
jgi:hypothetical protein